MPFTVSHVAAVVPLARLVGARTSFSALVIGAMVPDLGYYVRSWTLAVHLHTVDGAATSGVLIGLGLYLVFHLLVRPAYVRLLPYWCARRLGPENWRRGWPVQQPVWAVLLCLLLGAMTHVAWDSFTHIRAGSAWGDWFAAPVFDGAWPRYLVLQHVSTVGGALVLPAALVWWVRRTPAQHSPGAARHGTLGHPLLLLSLLVLPAVVGVAGAGVSLSGVQPLEEFVVRIAYFGGACVMALATVVGVIVPLGDMGRGR